MKYEYRVKKREREPGKKEKYYFKIINFIIIYHF